MNRVVTRLGITTLALVAGSVAAYSQSSTTGSISGRITDGAGKAVSGATITATSKQLTRTTTSGADGGFRLGLLNPGDWSLRVTHAGMSTVTSKVVATANADQLANFKLSSEAAVTVEVTGSVTSDFTTSQVGSNYSLDDIKSIPIGRDMNTIANLAPGVVSSTNATAFNGGNMGASIGGGSGAENSYIMDGLSTTDYGYGGIGNTLVTDFIDQVEVQTGGFKPEYSALGGVFNVVTKTGSNNFKGSAWLTYDATDWVAAPKGVVYYVNGTPRNFGQGAPDERYDIGFEVGGAIIPNKFFYFVGAQADLRKSAQDGPNNSGAVSDRQEIKQYQYIGKLNWYVSPDMQLTLFANYNPTKNDQPYGVAGVGSFGTGNVVGGSFPSKLEGYNLTFDWTINSNLFLTVKAGITKNTDEQKPTNTAESFISDGLWFWNGGTLTDGVANLPGGVGALGNSGPAPVATPGGARPGNFNRGGFGIYQNDYRKTFQLKADLSWFVGSHALKFGVSSTGAEYRVEEQTSGDGYSHSLRRTNIGLGSKFYDIRQTVGNKATVNTDFMAVYLQDTWEIASGFKFSFGARFEAQDLQDHNGKSFLKYDLGDGFQPRLGLIWDVNNDSRTKVSANYARYFEQIPMRLSIRQQAAEYFDRYYNPITSYNGGVGTPSFNPVEDLHYDFSTPFTRIPIMHGLELPQRDEYILGIDHTLKNGWTLGLHAKYREMTNPIEDITPYEDDKYFYGYVDKGTDWFGQAILANPHSGVMTWTTTPTSQSRLEDGITQFSWDSTYPEAYNLYESIDFTADKKTDRYYVSFSYTWSRLEGNYEGVVSSSNGQADGNITASWDYPNYWGKGPLPLDRTNVIKLQASRNWDLGPGRFSVGATASFQSGTPNSLFDNGLTSNPPVSDQGGYNNAIPQNHTLGQYGRTPTTKNVNLRLDYDWKIGKVSLLPSIDVFNLFNTRKATSAIQQYTDAGGVTGTWGLNTTWQNPRSFRVGLKARF